MKKTPTNAQGIISDVSYVEGLSGMSCAVPSEHVINLLSNKQIKEMHFSIENAMDLDNPKS